eukprot:m.471317 g.471317  ORF g.471317 m.471317 type:complete len:303 (-) comp30851_c0_seq1:2015-2923(-)
MGWEIGKPLAKRRALGLLPQPSRDESLQPWGWQPGGGALIREQRDHTGGPPPKSLQLHRGRCSGTGVCHALCRCVELVEVDGGERCRAFDVHRVLDRSDPPRRGWEGVAVRRAEQRREWPGRWRRKRERDGRLGGDVHVAGNGADAEGFGVPGPPGCPCDGGRRQNIEHGPLMVPHPPHPFKRAVDGLHSEGEHRATLRGRVRRGGGGHSAVGVPCPVAVVLQQHPAPNRCVPDVHFPHHRLGRRITRRPQQRRRFVVRDGVELAFAPAPCWSEHGRENGSGFDKNGVLVEGVVESVRSPAP